jgi:phosphoglycerate dehydrogenase-like enzyme
MSEVHLLVLADPTTPQLRLLDQLRGSTKITMGNKREEVSAAAAEAHVIFTWFSAAQLLREIWPRTTQVSWVHSMSAGLDTMLFRGLIDSPAVLTNGSGIFSQSLGEFVIAAVLYFAKDFGRMMRSQARGAWEPFDVEMVSGRTLGIIGYGDIGKAVARRAKSLDMKILALRRHPARSAGDTLVDEVFSPERRFDLLTRSDYVVLAAPLTEETRSLLGPPEIAALKPSAVVINVGRGPVIFEPALVEALENRRIRGAALDVFENEPLPVGHPYYRLENVLLSPHCADHIEGWMDQAVEFFVENFERFRKGVPLMNVVDKKLGY